MTFSSATKRSAAFSPRRQRRLREWRWLSREVDETGATNEVGHGFLEQATGLHWRGAADQPGQECFGEALPRLAVSAGVGGAWWQPFGTAPGHQACDGGAAAMVVAEGLGQEGAEGDQGREDPVSGLSHLLGDDPGECLGGEDVRQEEAGVEDEGTKEAAELSGAARADRIGRGGPSLSIEGGDVPSIGGEEGFLVYPLG